MKIDFPPDFVSRMTLQLGIGWDQFQAAHEADPPVSIRINPVKNTQPLPDPVAWTSTGQYLERRPVFTLDPHFHAGSYYVQEASSMFLEQVVRQSVDLSKSIRVLDGCAAPGGKSTHLLSMISPDSLLVSNEVIHSRATVLSENIQKWGYNNVLVSSNDPADFTRVAGFFDLIVIDAPCSGEGLFRKDPKAMQEWSVENAALCVQRQRRILSDFWPALREGGILIYCTCTYNEQENEGNLDWLSDQYDSESVPLRQNDFAGIEEVRKGRAIGYRLYPHRLRGEGFFIAAVRKISGERDARIKNKSAFSTPGRKTIDQLKTWIHSPDRYRFIQHEDLIVMIPGHQDVEFLTGQLKVITKGTAIAALKHEKLIPEHAAALSTALSKENFTRVQLDKIQSLAYLRKDVLHPNTLERGFALIEHEGLPLGWVNLLGNRVNNLYPSAWRIRNI